MMSISVKSLLSPVCILCTTALAQSLVLLVYVAGWWESWRIEFSDVTWCDLSGSMAVWGFLLASIYAGRSMISKSQARNLTGVEEGKNVVFNAIAMFCTVLSVVGVLLILKSAIGIGGADAIIMGVQGTLRAEMAGGGFLVFVIFSYLGVVVCTVCGNKKVLLLTNLACLFVIATMYAARMYFLAAVAMSAVIYLRKRCWKSQIRLFHIGVVIMVVAGLTVAVAALREFENSEDPRSSDQPVEWGVRTMVDYPLSTAIYSMHVDEMPPVEGIVATIPVLKRLLVGASGASDDDMLSFRECYGHKGYTNLGGWGQMQRVFGTVGSVVMLALFGVCTGFFWIKFISGDSAGLMLYPVFAYALFEFWRIAYLLEEIPQLVLFLLVCIVPFVRKEEVSVCAS